LTFTEEDRTSMKAIVQDRYGSPVVLALREIAMPAVAEDEVLVRVRGASIHPDVWHVMRGRPYVMRLAGLALRRPKHPVPGIDLAGVVEAVGAGVTRFRPGDEVFGETIKGYQWRNGGAFAEYAAAPEGALAPKPANLTFEQAAAVPTSALIALQGVRSEGRVRPGQTVLVNGAGGGVGTFAVQLAKAFGAHVTGVDAAAKLDMLRAIGADRVIDPAREDFAQGRYDVIVDIPGNRSIADCRRALTPDGTYVIIGHDGYGVTGGRWLGSLPRVLRLVAMSPFVSQLPKPDFSAPRKSESLVLLKELIEAGKLTPVVDRTFPRAARRRSRARSGGRRG
jgi:NADPH:quinone reductase-like Zn-dependent oxidoreductase